jgi:hypothetical protein
MHTHYLTDILCRQLLHSHLVHIFMWMKLADGMSYTYIEAALIFHLLVRT